MKRWLSYLIFFLLIPVTVLGGAFIFKQKQYAFLSLCVTVFSCAPFFLHFEKISADSPQKFSIFS